MFSSFLGSFCAWLVFLVGMCQAGILQASGSGLSPLSIVYTVYPYYNSEATLLGVVEASGEQIPAGAPGVPSKTIPDTAGNGDNATPNGEPANSGHWNRESSHNPAEQQLREITYWPPVQRGAAPEPWLGRAAASVRQKDFN